MKVEIWADIICPWCGLGSYRLDKAVERFEHGDEVEVIHRSFQLDPSMPTGPVTPRQMLKQKHGMAEAQVEAATRQVEQLAAADGLAPYIVLDNTVANTELAHEFLAYATAEGKHTEAWQRIFGVYFGEARPIFDVDALVELGAELGLDRDATRRALVQHRFRQQVSDDARQAQRLGARGVPFTVIDGQYAVSGAQDIDTLLGVLRQVWDETHQPVSLTDDADAVCGPDGCAVPSGHQAHA